MPSKEMISYIQNSLAPSTRRAYASDLNHFMLCGGRIPSTPMHVAKYLASNAEKLKVSTLTRRLAAIAHAHSITGKLSPTQAPLVRSTLRGIKRLHGAPQNQARPVTPAILRRLIRPFPEHSFIRNARDRALILVGFAAGFRRAELVQIAQGDMTFGRAGVTITLKFSKTDQNHDGRTIAIPRGQGNLCAVKAIKQWMELVKMVDKESNTPIFRRVDRHGNVGRPLTGASVGTILRERLRLCGIDVCGFSAHSLRAGMVTAAAEAGAPTWSIQRQTGHKSESSVHRYIRGISPFKLNASRIAMAG